MKRIFKAILTILLLVLIAWITYQISMMIAKGIGIEKEIIPSLAMTIPSMRGDIKVFSGLISLEILVAMLLYSDYKEKNFK